MDILEIALKKSLQLIKYLIKVDVDRNLSFPDFILICFTCSLQGFKWLLKHYSYKKI